MSWDNGRRGRNDGEGRRRGRGIISKTDPLTDARRPTAPALLIGNDPRLWLPPSRFGPGQGRVNRWICFSRPCRRVPAADQPSFHSEVPEPTCHKRRNAGPRPRFFFADFPRCREGAAEWWSGSRGEHVARIRAIVYTTPNPDASAQSALAAADVIPCARGRSVPITTKLTLPATPALTPRCCPLSAVATHAVLLGPDIPSRPSAKCRPPTDKASPCPCSHEDLAEQHGSFEPASSHLCIHPDLQVLTVESRPHRVRQCIVCL